LTEHIYSDLAGWFHLLTAPADYADEAAEYARILDEACDGPVGTLLELGSGGGNTASHLKARYVCTLTDLSEEMLDVSRSLNPECEHLHGDMRTLRLGREFDAVLVHDAVMYMTAEDDLRAAMATAFRHLRPGGAALFVPDCTRESFVEHTQHGGHDADRRSLRYLEWIRDPDPADTTFEVDFAILLADGDEPVRVVHDSHVHGLFGRVDWLAWLAEAGFEASADKLDVDADVPEYVGFVARRPINSS
jgi:SAM-dependent methyltransferase